MRIKRRLRRPLSGHRFSRPLRRARFAYADDAIKDEAIDKAITTNMKTAKKRVDDALRCLKDVEREFAKSTNACKQYSFYEGMGGITAYFVHSDTLKKAQKVLEELNSEIRADMGY